MLCLLSLLLFAVVSYSAMIDGRYNRMVSPVQVALSYDPLGRLWSTQSEALGGTLFLHDGDHVAVEYDANGGGIRRRFFWGPGVDEPILQDEGGALNCSGSRFLHTDHQGSIVAAATCGETRAAVNTYDEYGIPGAANWGRFQYTGQAWLADLGMYNYLQNSSAQSCARLRARGGRRVGG